MNRLTLLSRIVCQNLITAFQGVLLTDILPGLLLLKLYDFADGLWQGTELALLGFVSVHLRRVAGQGGSLGAKFFGRGKRCGLHLDKALVAD